MRRASTAGQSRSKVINEGYSDEVLRRVRPIITTRAIEKARAHLDALLLRPSP